MDATHPASYTLSDYLGLLRRHWWIVLLLTAVGVGGADGYTARQPMVFEADASVLVAPAGGADSNVVGGRTKGEINLDTEAQLVRSTAVAVEAGKLLRVDTPPDLLARGVSVDVPANTSVLLIQYSADSARAAQAGSHAFAEAYLRNREGSAKADLASQVAILETKLKQLNSSLTQINTRLAGLVRNSAERENLESQRGTIVNQINTLAGRLNQLSTSTISAGKIISDARLPSRPSQPNTPLNLATGVMLGLLLGLGVALARERLDRRVRVTADVTRRANVPVLAEFPAGAAPRLDDVYPPYGTGGRTFNRLRNEVLASLDTDDRVVVVTGASRGHASALVSANLAAALARTGSEVTLVCAHLPDSMAESISVARLIGVCALPGLSDVLAGRVRLADALQRAPRNPRLSVLTTGGAATAAGLLQSQTLRDTLATLRTQAEYVVIEAPSTATSADAQSLAGLADAAILVVELRRTRHVEVTDAAEQLRRIGTPLLGAVVLPRVRVAGAVPLGALPVGALPLGAVPLGAVPLGAVPLGAVPLGAVPVGALPVGSAVSYRPALSLDVTGEVPAPRLGSARTNGARLAADDQTMAFQRLDKAALDALDRDRAMPAGVAPADVDPTGPAVPAAATLPDAAPAPNGSAAPATGEPSEAGEAGEPGQPTADGALEPAPEPVDGGAR